MPLETLLAVEGAHGIELFNSSAERENLRGDSSYVWDQCLERGRRLWGFATDDCHYPGFDINDAWTMVRAAERSEEAVIEALRRGHLYATSGPQIIDIAIDGDAFEVRCSPAEAVVMMSRATRPGGPCDPMCATARKTRGCWSATIVASWCARGSSRRWSCRTGAS